MLLPRARQTAQSLPRLHDDVLRLVFEQLVVDLDTTTALTEPVWIHLVLSSVCQSWRHVAIRYSDLWRYHHVDCARIRSTSALADYAEVFAAFLRRSRGDFRALRIVNFPGPTGAMPQAPRFWTCVITQGLSTCESFLLRTVEGGPRYMPIITQIVQVLGMCAAPRLTTAAVSVGHCDATQVRIDVDSIFNTPATTNLRTLVLNGVNLRDPSRVCGNCHLATLHFGGGSFFIQVAPLLVDHHATLRALALFDVDMPVQLMQLASLPALTTLALRGRSIHLLPRLPTTSLPQLSSIRLDFHATPPAVTCLSIFLNQHPEIRITELTLRNIADLPGEFAFFVPSIGMLRDLRHLTIEGNIESAFFATLTGPDGVNESMLHNLSVLDIACHHTMSDAIPSLIDFLERKAALSGSPTLNALHIRSSSGLLSHHPLNYATALALNRTVQHFTICNRDAVAVLDDVAYWVPVQVMVSVLGKLFIWAPAYTILLCWAISQVVSG
ncbi:hypothetical protein AURDEDRAFT_177821 [Auricularia subglabra TFB-10046 SS5]|uniref:F-box domain-containing protein n=1 Tax=Auricularia subglabra (strain TFB-10046 / SS5) TaxID=717982 RepID=J0L9Q0_AURST|nr:hypothetical protein AURDEDRAFT_177821 [Auricularia subglabra TFB-10046 SS5]